MSGPLPVESTPCPFPQDVQEMQFHISLAGNIPPFFPNTNPQSNLTSSCPPGLPKVKSMLNRDVWHFYLVDYPDCVFVDFLLNIIDIGASIGHMGPPKSQYCKNLQSSTNYPDEISKEIKSLHSLKHVHGPFPAPALPYF